MKITTLITICLLYFNIGIFAENSPERIQVARCDIITQLRYLASHLNLKLFIVIPRALHDSAFFNTRISTKFRKEKFDTDASQSTDMILNQYFNESSFTHNLNEKENILYVELCKLPQVTTQTFQRQLTMTVKNLALDDIGHEMNQYLRKKYSTYISIQSRINNRNPISINFKNTSLRKAIRQTLTANKEIGTVICGITPKGQMSIYFHPPAPNLNLQKFINALKKQSMRHKMMVVGPVGPTTNYRDSLVYPAKHFATFNTSTFVSKLKLINVFNIESLDQDAKCDIWSALYETNKIENLDYLVESFKFINNQSLQIDIFSSRILPDPNLYNRRYYDSINSILQDPKFSRIAKSIKKNREESINSNRQKIIQSLKERFGALPPTVNSLLQRTDSLKIKSYPLKVNTKGLLSDICETSERLEYLLQKAKTVKSLDEFLELIEE